MSGDASLDKARRAHIPYIRAQLAHGHRKGIHPMVRAPVNKDLEMLFVRPYGVPG